MTGELVILRIYGGQPIIRRIFQITERVIFVTDDSRKDSLISVGIPREDVFKYDSDLAAHADSLFYNGQRNWNNLKRYFEEDFPHRT